MTANREKHNHEILDKRKKRCIDDNCIQILAWILLTVGLCIIITVFYLALRSHGTNTDDEIDSDERVEYEENNSFETSFELNGLRRSIDPGHDVNGCSESYCRILCSDNRGTFYEDVDHAVKSSDCGTTTSLTIHNLQRHCIRNAWLASNGTVHKIFIVSSKLTTIKSGAFNVPMFASTFLMNWHELELDSLDSGALLGLYSLKYLNIRTKLPGMDAAFLQPVQTTLTHLRLNAALKFMTNSSLFGNTFFDKLVYIDLSNNNFKGALNRRLFRTTPNLKYIYIRYAKITTIEPDTFVDLAGKLQVLNLGFNLLTTLSDQVLLPLLNGRTYLEFEPNNWHCDCELSALIEQYAEHSAQFMSPLYCKWPLDLYGSSFDTLKPAQLSCDGELALQIESQTETPLTSTIAMQSESQSVTTPKPIIGPVIQFICEGAPNLHSTKTDCDHSTEESSTSNENSNVQFDLPVFLVFEPPSYDLVLQLHSDRTVNVTIEGYDGADKLNIVWFSERFDDESRGSDILDYNCLAYAEPYFIIDSLKANTTYTFCMVPENKGTVSPLNCQPLHVPAVRQNEFGDIDDDYIYGDDDVVISTKEKQFTIGILCLIFFMSTLVGGVVAYLSIKTYPDLLEGSKNVLVVKKSDKTCYISTIGETEKATNMKKNTLTLPDVQPAKKLDRLSSVKSSSTIFDDASSHNSYPSDDYELPKMFDESYYAIQSCVPNNYAMSPGSPPPLPKRNSNLSNSKFNKIQTVECFY